MAIALLYEGEGVALRRTGGMCRQGYSAGWTQCQHHAASLMRMYSLPAGAYPVFRQ